MFDRLGDSLVAPGIKGRNILNCISSFFTSPGPGAFGAKASVDVTGLMLVSEG